MQTFWSHLTFFNFGQPLLSRLGSRTLLSNTAHQLVQAQSLPALDFGLKFNYVSLTKCSCVLRITFHSPE